MKEQSIGKPSKTKTDRARVAAMKDADIVFDEDAPLFVPEHWQNGTVFQHGLPTLKKNQMTIRFDADVVAWFKSFGRGYQSRMNAVLREYMMASKNHHNVYQGLRED